MITRVIAIAVLAWLMGCSNNRPSVTERATVETPNERVLQQIDTIRGYSTVMSVEQCELPDGEPGWRVTYRPSETRWDVESSPVKWIMLRRDSGYVAAMSPEYY